MTGGVIWPGVAASVAFVCVVVEPGARTAAVAWEAPAKRPLGLSVLCSDGRLQAGRCCSSYCSYQQRVLRRQVLLQQWWSTGRDRSHRTGPLDKHCVGTSGYVCLVGRMQMQLPHGIQKEPPPPNRKINEKDVSMNLLVRDNTWAGPPV